MSTSPLEEIRRLKAELASARQTIDRVGHGLNQLERTMTPAVPPTMPPVARPAMPPGVAPAPPVGAPVAPPRPGPTIPPMPPIPPIPVAPRSPLGAWWQRESTIVRVLGVAGAIVTLVGLSLLLVLAVQQNWFTPQLRVGLGAGLSVALVAIAWWLRHHEPNRRSGAGVVALAATGHAGLYLVVLAITRLYHWVGAPVGLVLAGVVAAIGILTAVRWQSELMAILQVVCIGLLAFPLSEGPGWAGAFVVLVAVGLAPLHVHTWKRLGVANFLTAGLVQLVAVTVARPEDDLWLVTITSALLLLVGVGTAVAEVRGARASSSGVFVTVSSGLPWLALSWLHRPWVAVGLLGSAVVLGFVVFIVTPRDRAGGDGFGWATMVLPALAVMLLVVRLPGPDGLVPAWLLAAACVFFAVAGLLRAEPVAGAGFLVSLVALITLVRPLEQAFSRQLMREQPWSVLLAIGLVAACWAGVALWMVTRLERIRSALRASLVLAVVIGLLGLMMASVAGGVGIGRSIGDEDAGFTSGHAIGTIVWMLAAAVLLVRGLKRAEHADLGIKLALGLAAAAVAKLFLYDLATLDGIWRGAAFVVVGLLLLGLGIGYAKALERARTARG
ncbi:DUF2339 domain-containing protein [Propionibacteriaceae bacterium Y1923]